MSDLVLRGGIVAGRRQDVLIRDGRIHRTAPDVGARAADGLDVADRLVLPGFVESHIHPDKAFIADRTQGLRAGGPTPQTLVAELKKSFTVDDIHRRARRVMELAVRDGTTTMRAHVEIDASVELRGVEALRRLQAELAGVLDLRLIAFAQEGLFNDDVTRDLLREALTMGLDTLGGCPYMDRDQRAHSDWCFDTAEPMGVPLDFHADSSDDPALLTSDYIAEQAIARGMQGRVTLGQCCTLDVLEPDHRARVIEKTRAAGIHVISLRATELHVKARTDVRRTWRGIARLGELRDADVNVALSTNNIVNPFTPYSPRTSCARPSWRRWRRTSGTSTPVSTVSCLSGRTSTWVASKGPSPVFSTVRGEADPAPEPGPRVHARLLGPRAVVVETAQHLVEERGRVPGVVDGRRAEGLRPGVVRHLGRADEVPPADLGGVDAEASGPEVWAGRRTCST